MNFDLPVEAGSEMNLDLPVDAGPQVNFGPPLEEVPEMGSEVPLEAEADTLSDFQLIPDVPIGPEMNSDLQLNPDILVNPVFSMTSPPDVFYEPEVKTESTPRQQPGDEPDMKSIVSDR